MKMIKKILSITAMTLILSTNFIFSNDKIKDNSLDIIELELDAFNLNFDEKRVTIENCRENVFYKLPLENSLNASGFIVENGIVEFKFSDYKQYEAVDDNNAISLTAYRPFESNPYFSKILDESSYDNTKVKLNDEVTFIVIDSTKNNTIAIDEDCLTLFFK